MKTRETLSAKAEELIKKNELGLEYSNYWKLLGDLLERETIIVHTISLIVIINIMMLLVKCCYWFNSCSGKRSKIGRAANELG